MARRKPMSPAKLSEIQKKFPVDTDVTLNWDGFDGFPMWLSYAKAKIVKYNRTRVVVKATINCDEIAIHPMNILEIYKMVNQEQEASWPKPVAN